MKAPQSFCTTLELDLSFAQRSRHRTIMAWRHYPHRPETAAATNGSHRLISASILADGEGGSESLQHTRVMLVGFTLNLWRALERSSAPSLVRCIAVKDDRRHATLCVAVEIMAVILYPQVQTQAARAPWPAPKRAPLRARCDHACTFSSRRSTWQHAGAHLVEGSLRCGTHRKSLSRVFEREHHAVCPPSRASGSDKFRRFFAVFMRREARAEDSRKHVAHRASPRRRFMCHRSCKSCRFAA